MRVMELPGQERGRSKKRFMDVARKDMQTGEEDAEEGKRGRQKKGFIDRTRDGRGKSRLEE